MSSVHAFTSLGPAVALARRASPRLDVDGALQIRHENGSALVIFKDISSGGFAILTGEPVLAGTVRRFRIGLPGSATTLVSARAAHTQQVEPGVYLSGWMPDDAEAARVIADAFDRVAGESRTDEEPKAS